MAVVQSQSTKLCSHCLPDCNHIAYSTSTTSAEFRCAMRFSNLNLSSLSRRCDSRNLNLSPFCGLDASSTPLKLQPTVYASYGSIDPNYVQNLPSPMRKEYPIESMVSNEILSTLAEVWLWLFTKRNIPICSQDDPVYNAYERDIALVNLFFPDSTVFGQSSIQKVKLLKISIIIKNITSAEFEKSPKMTWFDFISSFGGFCGLCLGISFVSVVEILYWFSIRLCRNFAIWIGSFGFYLIRQL